MTLLEEAVRTRVGVRRKGTRTKTKLIGFFDSLTNILNCLRAYLLPIFHALTQLGNMFHQFVYIQVLTKHFVVSLMKSNTVIVDAATSVYLPMDTSILLGLIQLEFIGFHQPIVQ